MKISKMAPVFEQLSRTLPLQVNAANLASWLDTLDPGEAYYSCGKLLRVMKSLQAESLPEEAEFIALRLIIGAFDQVGAKLEKPLLESGNPIGVSERINAELMVYSYAEIAQHFWKLAAAFAAPNHSGGGKKRVVYCLYYAMEALRRALLYVSYLYDRPYEGFWQLCYRIYRRAESLDLLAVPAGSSTSAAHDTVDNSFKNLLVFYLSDPGSLTQREMKGLFMLFHQRQVPAKIYHHLDADQLPLAFAFAADADAPPQPANHLPQAAEHLRYVSTIKVARMAYTNLTDESNCLDKSDSGNYSLLCKLTKSLSMKSTRKLSRVTEHRECQALFGFNNIFNFLTYKYNAVWDTSELALVPQGEEEHPLERDLLKPVGFVPAADNPFAEADFDLSAAVSTGSKNAGRSKRFIFETVNIVDSSAKDYTVVRGESGVPVKVGELLGVMNKADERMELGLIRRISHYEQLDAELSLELLSLDAGVAALWRSGNEFDRQPVLFLPAFGAGQQKHSVIFRGHSFSVGETVYIQRAGHKGICRIEKILYATQAFTHAELC